MSNALRTLAVAFAVASAIALPKLAHAQDKTGDAPKDCPPGSWFCGETQPPSKDLQPLPGEKDKAEKDKADAKPAPPVVVYQPPPVVVRDAPPTYTYVPRKPVPKKEWGVNIHLAGLMMGEGRDGNAGMGLMGVGIRFRPVPHMAIEGDLDFAGGRDYNGYRRGETALNFNGLLFVNPQNRVQVYFLGGFGFSGAHAVDDRAGYTRAEYDYAYVGVQVGGGLEFRLGKVVALNVDLRGFVRSRIDRDARYTYEFADGDRRTNTSGGGLLTGGMTFYW